VAGALAGDAAMSFSTGCRGRRGEEGCGFAGRVEGDEVRFGDGRDGVLWIKGTESNDLRAGAGAGEGLGKHGAVVPAVAAAADGEAGVGVLSKGKGRRDDRKNEGGEQDESEKTAHAATGLVYVGGAVRAKWSVNTNRERRLRIGPGAGIQER
jgi:hypothetical protein